MRRFAFLWVSLAAAAFPARAAAEPARVTVDNAVLQVEPTYPVLACAVIRTTGDPAVDDAACNRALREAGAPARTMTFQPDERGRFVSCRPVPGIDDSPEFRSQCSTELQRIRHMRAMTPLGMRSWLRPTDLAALPTPSGRALVRIGVDDQGRPAYCLLVEPRGDASLERSLCSRITNRARFHPARDMQGRPMASTFMYPTSWRVEDRR